MLSIGLHGGKDLNGGEAGNVFGAMEKVFGGGEVEGNENGGGEFEGNENGGGELEGDENGGGAAEGKENVGGGEEVVCGCGDSGLATVAGIE